MASEHLLRLTASLVVKDSLRYTPAGLAAISFTVQHASRQIEAGMERQVELELQCLALGAAAMQVTQMALGSTQIFCGFLCPTRKGARALRMHVTGLAEPESN
jgi:primosomal replication protein N